MIWGNSDRGAMNERYRGGGPAGRESCRGIDEDRLRDSSRRREPVPPSRGPTLGGVPPDRDEMTDRAGQHEQMPDEMPVPKPVGGVERDPRGVEHAARGKPDEAPRR